MNVQEIEREIEHVDKTANANTDSRDLLALIARGIWVLALQVAIITDQAEHEKSR